MANYIDIDEFIEDKKTRFNIKTFKIGENNFKRPEKVLDIKNISKEAFKKLIEKKHNFRLFEVSKTIKTFNSIENLAKKEEDGEINRFFCEKKWIKGSQLINFTFNFNPYNYLKNFEEDIGWFFDYYYQYSDMFLFVPNIRKYRYVPIRENSKETKKESIIHIEEYLKFVDSCHEYMDHKNTKFIFVPISLKLSKEDIVNLANHYIEKKYCYFWFDFEGRAITRASLARLRYFFRIMKKSENYREIISYFTNINREITSKPDEIESPASDVLASVAGANLIGVNRKPQRRIEEPLPPPKNEQAKIERRKHKFRIFDNESYYYTKIDDNNFHEKGRNIAYNSIALDNEFISQSEYFLENFEMENYLKRKRMLIEYRNGEILKLLTKK